MNIWVKKTDDSFENARPLTDSKRPLTTFYWTSEGKYLVFVKDHNGDENLNIFAVSPYENVSEGELPATRNLTPFKNIAARIYKINDKDPDTMMIGLNDRDKAWYDLYKLRVSNGELKLIYENKDRIALFEFDWNDELRILFQRDENGTTTFLFKKDDVLVPIYQNDNSETAYTIEFNEENSKFYLVSNKGDVNLTTLYLFNPVTKEAEKIESDPINRVNINKVWINRLNKKIISTIYIDDKMEYNWHDKEWEKLYNYLKSKFPDREISFTSYTKDYSKLLVTVEADKYAPEIYLLDTKTKDLTFQYTPMQELKNLEKYLSPMQPVRYKSSDGLEIPAYLTVPSGVKPQNLPLVVIPHGGPKGFRDYWEFNPVVQYCNRISERVVAMENSFRMPVIWSGEN
ncbi:MAG: Peptidase S9 prolyl oligopeptidase active site domain protein [Candidatus Uhrbacteria bacterium GW2011_GWF2_39_13]|uniref:Peptidase S9 prolyl oligopeptidase active site domain protein n=1 Tax=Candidatus Uhrbacteria bacterium GW2011_GWF2_39_13 TaxID=1618995 RepID=A0A0G0QM67_9BACT|nr:MAG: Peptidase S9 prolyl oligopeptidase active site domain protein [Candidatus Uhrbacteria bacterium GW2011_GWF2_39_13]